MLLAVAIGRTPPLPDVRDARPAHGGSPPPHCAQESRSLNSAERGTPETAVSIEQARNRIYLPGLSVNPAACAFDADVVTPNADTQIRKAIEREVEQFNERVIRGPIPTPSGPTFDHPVA